MQESNGLTAIAFFLVLLLFGIGTQAFAGHGPDHLQKVQSCMHNIDCKKLMIVAHRMGFMGPNENTLWALRKNLELDNDILEFSVRETGDGHLVVIHDDDLARTTNGSGKVGSTSLTHLKKLRINGLPDETVPTLEEVLDFSKNRFFLQVSVKSASVEKVWRAIKAKQMETQVFLFLYKKGQHQEINKLLKAGEKFLFMPRLRQGESLLGIIQSFLITPPLMHIDDETLTKDTLQILKVYNIRPYIKIPSRSTTDALRTVGLEYMSRGLFLFQTDQSPEVNEALSEFH